MEVHSAKTYWHMQQTSEQIDQVFTARRMLGNLGALDKTTSTWFGSKLEYVHGINM